MAAVLAGKEGQNKKVVLSIPPFMHFKEHLDPDKKEETREIPLALLKKKKKHCQKVEHGGF